MEKQRLIHGSAELVDKILWIPKTFTVRPSDTDVRNCSISTGEGSNARHIEVANEIAASLLASKDGLFEEEWINYFEESLSLNIKDATSLAQKLQTNGILTDDSHCLTPSESQWLELNWSDALHEYWLEHDMIWKHDYRNNPKVMTISNGKNVIPDTPPPAPRVATPLPNESTVILPRGAALQKSFSRTVQERRTGYRFSKTLVCLEDLSSILRWTMKGLWTDGVAPLRVTQSYSRGEPFVAFVLPGRNPPSPLKKGTCYQYDPVSEGLIPVSHHQEDRLSSFLWGQQFADEAPVNVIFAANWAHYMWKYRSPRAYRWVFTEGGSFAQTMLMAATALGYKTWQTPALDDEKFKKLVNSHPMELEAIYLISIGKRVDNE